MTAEPPLLAEGALLRDIVDFVIPLLPPYETSLYLYLLRRSHLGDPPSGSVRVGKRTIGEDLGKGTRASRGNYQHISEKLTNLASMGFIQIGDTDRAGTVYRVDLPSDVPAVRERMAISVLIEPAINFYCDPNLRRQLFERDRWTCRYCGESLTEVDATLDHMVPRSAGGTDEEANLATTCLMCNAIKSGRTLEDAAPQILAAVARRRSSQE